MKQVVGRFAPSPSGRMHLGNVLCALLSWLSARSQGGRYLLRIEDLDTHRCPRSYADRIEEDLAWLGLEWDAGGSRGGPHGSYYQSERSGIYAQYLNQIEQMGRVYPCFCSRAALHGASAPHLSDGRVIYAGTCRTLTEEQIVQKYKVRSPAMRLRVPDETILFTDLVQGRQCQHLSTECGDFIIRRSDGVFAYQLAVVVDDALEGVTEVIRGRDLLESTARQIWLHRLFGFTPPSFAHIPLLNDVDGRRLSKRDADLDLGVLRKRFTPEQIIGALACAVGLIPEPQPIGARELIPLFDWRKIPKQDICLPSKFF